MFRHFVVALALVALHRLQARAADSELQQIADALDVSTTKTFAVHRQRPNVHVGQSTSPMAAFPQILRKELDANV